MINWTRVEELRNDLGPDDFDEVVMIFLEEVEERLKHLASGASDDVSEDFHFLKGCAANLGFDSFKDICSEGEKKGSDEYIVPAQESYERSKSEFLSATLSKAS